MNTQRIATLMHRIATAGHPTPRPTPRATPSGPLSPTAPTDINHTGHTISTGQIELFAIVVVLGFLVYWRRSLTTHSITPCPACNGTGKSWHPVFRKAYQPCSACNGTGRKQRWWSRIFHVPWPPK